LLPPVPPSPVELLVAALLVGAPLAVLLIEVVAWIEEIVELTPPAPPGPSEVLPSSPQATRVIQRTWRAA
jgi:hypothetical protein